MRIAGGMDVTVGAIDNARNVEAIDLRRRLEIPRPPGWMAALPESRRPAATSRFQVGAGATTNPALPRLRQQRRFGLDAVRVLEGVGRAINLTLSPPISRANAPFGDRGKNPQVGLGDIRRPSGG